MEHSNILIFSRISQFFNYRIPLFAQYAGHYSTHSATWPSYIQLSNFQLYLHNYNDALLMPFIFG